MYMTSCCAWSEQGTFCSIIRSWNTYSYYRGFLQLFPFYRNKLQQISNRERGNTSILKMNVFLKPLSFNNSIIGLIHWSTCLSFLKMFNHLSSCAKVTWFISHQQTSCLSSGGAPYFKWQIYRILFQQNCSKWIMKVAVDWMTRKCDEEIICYS